MKNLSGDPGCDPFIRDELTKAGIPVVPVEKGRTEVPYSLIGKLGAFTFTRGWYYWCADGPMPSEAALRMAKTPCPMRVTWYRYTLRIRPDKQRRYHTLYGARMGADHHGGTVELSDAARLAASALGWQVIRADCYAGGLDPDKHPNHYRNGVDSYHIDTQKGLNLFAETVRRLAGRTP